LQLTNCGLSLLTRMYQFVFILVINVMLISATSLPLVIWIHYMRILVGTNRFLLIQVKVLDLTKTPVVLVRSQMEPVRAAPINKLPCHWESREKMAGKKWFASR